MHYMDANKTAGEEAGRQLYKNAANNLEQVLAATPHKTYIYNILDIYIFNSRNLDCDPWVSWSFLQNNNHQAVKKMKKILFS